MISFIHQASSFGTRTAITDTTGSHSYQTLLQASHRLAQYLLQDLPDLAERRVPFLVNPGFDYVTVQWAVWLAGGIAVPLCIQHPLHELRNTVENCQAGLLIADSQHEKQIKELSELTGLPYHILQREYQVSGVPLPDVANERRAMILYTSGTTSRPKGVVTSHQNIQAQIECLVNAWAWTKEDKIICVLPLHHVHGIINVVACALAVGAEVRFLYPFSADLVLQTIENEQISLFMAVPTIYFKLAQFIESYPIAQQIIWRNTLSRLRLMVSGSAALPASLFEKWKELSGHTLLERYGMTEIGMAICNPYQGERKPGYIGLPLPNVLVRLENGENQAEEKGYGEIQIKGPAVFLEYWNLPLQTQASFTQDGWFKTGDIAILENEYYKIVGRDSVDIIKSGGYKISALEIEEILRQAAMVVDCAVVGIPDDEWGEIVWAFLITHSETLDSDQLIQWLRLRLPPYKIPRQFSVVDEFPLNTMGKVLKTELKKMGMDKKQRI
jgi:malonyl-CoA/methylmalonyl-CoA synthetase